MALLSERSVDKHIFERAPLSTKIIRSTLICLSLAATERSGVTRTSSFIRTQTTHSTAAAPLKEIPPNPKKTIQTSAASQHRHAHFLWTHAAHVLQNKQQQHFTSLSLHFPKEVWMMTGPHGLCIYIRYKTHCSNVYINNTNESIQLLIRLYIQSSKINMWWQNKQQISPFCSSLVWYSLKYTTASSAQSKNTKLYF